MYVIKAQQNADVYEQRPIAESPFVACVSPLWVSITQRLLPLK